MSSQHTEQSEQSKFFEHSEKIILPPISTLTSLSPIKSYLAHNSNCLYIQESASASSIYHNEKRKRSAEASARFRDRKKQTENERIERCKILEKIVQELENDIIKLNEKIERINNENKELRHELENKVKSYLVVYILL